MRARRATEMPCVGCQRRLVASRFALARAAAIPVRPAAGLAVGLASAVWDAAEPPKSEDSPPDGAAGLFAGFTAVRAALQTWPGGGRWPSLGA